MIGSPCPQEGQCRFWSMNNLAWVSYVFGKSNFIYICLHVLLSYFYRDSLLRLSHHTYIFTSVVKVVNDCCNIVYFYWPKQSKKCKSVTILEPQYYQLSHFCLHYTLNCWISFQIDITLIPCVTQIVVGNTKIHNWFSNCFVKVLIYDCWTVYDCFNCKHDHIKHRFVIFPANAINNERPRYIIRRALAITTRFLLITLQWGSKDWMATILISMDNHVNWNTRPGVIDIKRISTMARRY